MKKSPKEKSVNKRQTDKDLYNEYLKLFNYLNYIKHEYEWSKEGDMIKQFSLYENSPIPELANNTNYICNA